MFESGAASCDSGSGTNGGGETVSSQKRKQWSDGDEEGNDSQLVLKRIIIQEELVGQKVHSYNSLRKI